MAARPAAGRTSGFVHFFARTASHILIEEGTRSSFTLSSSSLFTLPSDINSKVPQQRQLSRHSNSISNLHSAFDISSRRLQQSIYIEVRERQPAASSSCSAARPQRFAGATLLNLRSVEHLALLHASITLRALLTILCRAQRVRSAAPHITLLLLRLRNPAAPSAFAPLHIRIILRALR